MASRGNRAIRGTFLAMTTVVMRRATRADRAFRALRRAGGLASALAFGWALVAASPSARAAKGLRPIRSVEVINADYSGMARFFRRGARFDTNHPLILMVGPVGSGKTGFLRLVGTSLAHRQHFDKHGISKLWSTADAESLVSEAARAKRQPDGWYKPLGSHVGWSQLGHLLGARAGFSPRDDLRRGGEVSPKVIQRARTLESDLKKPTDENRYTYMKLAESGAPVYALELATPTPTDHPTMGGGWREGHRSFLEFDPSYDGKTSMLARMGNIQSPGESAIAAAEKLFGQIETFMTQGEYVPFKANARRGTMASMMSFGPNTAPQPEKVSSKAQLVVFMDEPTAFMDIGSRRRFRKQLDQALTRYGSRLQVFMTTHDEVLINHGPKDRRVISLYQQPAVISTPEALQVPE